MDFQKTLAWMLEDAQRMWEFRWVALLCAWLVAAGGWVTVRLIPDSYEAHARVYVDAEGVLKPLLKDLTVPTDPIEQVKLMTRALLSRPHLETIATKTGLGARAENEKERERLLVELEQTILVTRPQLATDDQIYTISYSDHDPAMARDVVQALLDDFIGESMTGDRTASAQARTFLQGQIKVYEDRLTAAENRLAEFKTKNMGLIQGESEGDFYGRFQTARTEVAALQSQIGSLTDKRNELARQLANEASSSSNGSDPLRSSSVDPAISNLEEEMAQLQLRFTDKHPDVVRARQTLEDLYKIREDELRGRAASGRLGQPAQRRSRIAADQDSPERRRRRPRRTARPAAREERPGQLPARHGHHDSGSRGPAGPPESGLHGGEEGIRNPAPAPRVRADEPGCTGGQEGRFLPCPGSAAHAAEALVATAPAAEFAGSCRGDLRRPAGGLPARPA